MGWSTEDKVKKYSVKRTGIIRHKISTRRGAIDIAWDPINRAPVDPFFSRTRVAKTNSLDWNVLIPNRAGIIPYRKDHDGTIRLCLGRDRKSGDLTDFGGGVSYKTDANAVAGALRELEEEGCRVWKPTLGQVMLTSLCVYNQHSSVFFLPIFDISTREQEEILRKEFLNRVSPKAEMSDLVWVDLDDFLHLIRFNTVAGNKMYTRVAKLLSNNLAFVNRL